MSNHNLQKSLDKLFVFLEQNRKYNHSLQSKSYKNFLSPFDLNCDKIYSLLHHIANTQSQPNINMLSIFFQKVYSNRNKLSSFHSFTELLLDKKLSSSNYETLYKAIKVQKGWGNKTAALFTKSIYHLHNGKYDKDFKIWDDAPIKFDHNERFYLPVDTVIEAIFHKLNPEVKWSFDKINKFLHNHYSSEQMEIWDDLWFWGFISQKGSGLNREFIWNEQKYWALLETEKDVDSIEDIKNRIYRFLSILN